MTEVSLISFLSDSIHIITYLSDRGRSHYRSHYSKWSREKKYVPGLPPFLPSNIPQDELEALLIRFRIEEIGYKLKNNLLDLELRAR